MKENEVRERVQAFLKNTVRLVVVPASMGIGLALIGCGDSSEDTGLDAGADVVAMAGQSGQSGAGGAATVYSAPIFDAGVGGSGGTTSTGGAGGAATVYSAPIFDAGVGGAGGITSTGGTGGAATVYSAPIFDAGVGGSGGTTSTGGAIGLYSASFFDAGVGGALLPDAAVSTGGIGGMATRYGAPMSSGGIVSGGGSTALPTGGTTTPVTRYGGIFPGSSSRNGSS